MDVVIEQELRENGTVVLNLVENQYKNSVRITRRNVQWNNDRNEKIRGEVRISEIGIFINNLMPSFLYSASIYHVFFSIMLAWC